MDRLTSAPLLYLHSGIPVVDIVGEWNDTMNRTLAELIDRLSKAGHFDIIVNLSHTSRLPLLEQTWRRQIEHLASCVSTHCGHLDLVGTAEQVRGSSYVPGLSQVRWATSEEEAIGRIKGVPVWRSGSKVIMRLSHR